MRIARSVSNLQFESQPSYQSTNVALLNYGRQLSGIGYTAYNDSFFATVDSAVPGTSQVVAENQQPGESWIDTLSRVLQTVVMADSQKKYLETNLELAKQGKPPISASAYGLGVSVGIDDNTKKMLMLFGGGALAIAALAIYSKRK
jgi:hypothetical protein